MSIEIKATVKIEGQGPLEALVVVLEVKRCQHAPSRQMAALEVVHDTNSLSLHRYALALLEQCHEWDEHELSVRIEAKRRLGS